MQVSGQSRFYPWSVYVYVGLSEYKGDLGNGMFGFQTDKVNYSDIITGLPVTNQPGIAGIGLNRWMSQRWNLNFSYYHGEWGYDKPDKSGYFHCRVNSMHAALQLKLVKEDEALLHPFLLFGLGYRNVKVPKSGGDINHTWQLPVGAGLTVRLGNRMQVSWQTTFFVSGSDVADGLAGFDSSPYDLGLDHQLSLGWMFRNLQPGAGKSKCPKF